MATPTTLPNSFTTGQILTASQMNNLRGAFRVLQIVSTTKTDIFSSSQAAGTSVDVTGLSASITPSATSSKILVSATIHGTLLFSTNYYPILSTILKRGGTAIGGGTTAGNRTAINGLSYTNSTDVQSAAANTFNFLDSPNSTSAQTYQIALFNALSATATIFCNQQGNDGNFAYWARPSSTITVMEISA
jgi:hypothetical protein